MEIEIPSRVFNRPFVWAPTKVFQSQKDHSRAGKWMMFLSLKKNKNGLTELDRVWKCICEATYEGFFYKASASTAMQTKFSQPDYGVICVHSTNYEDVDEVGEDGLTIKRLLYMLCVDVCRDLDYKTYKDTLKGVGRRRNLYNIRDHQDEHVQFLRQSENQYQMIDQWEVEDVYLLDDDDPIREIITNPTFKFIEY